MLSKEENDLITRTGPGTPMGNLFRRFWLPIMLSEELSSADGEPVRLRVLGEDLLAFRDTGGRVGLIEPFCAHRGAPLFFGRNEQHGLRCIYHGWKFDVYGSCLEVPNALEGATYKDKVKLFSYPLVEKAGFLWTYMGPTDKQPPLPQFDWMDLPPGHCLTTKIISNCNYLQSLEGAMDSTHTAWLHSTLDPANNPLARQGFLSTENFIDKMAQYTRVEDTDYGVMAVTERNIGNGDKWVSLSQWIAPTFTPGGRRGSLDIGYTRMRVPIDDENCMVFRVRYDLSKPLTHEIRQDYGDGELYTPEFVPGTYQPVASKDNDYQIDRFIQKNFTFSGLRGVNIQDIAMVENQWGPIADRTREHLVTSDEMIIRMRRHLMKMARDLEEGTDPPLVNRPELFAVGGGAFRLSPGDSLEAKLSRYTQLEAQTEVRQQEAVHAS